ncbi:unnamed protein product [Brassica rapa]|uniref:Uncharacterized protein n=1 Tax=Brassica campestris TaxID=3711 RepID=A0A8D9CZE6_BRACM|nr:unnamed protein product [Brassica rapa]
METRQTQAENGRVSEEQSHLYLHRFRNRCRKTNRNSTGTGDTRLEQPANMKARDQ